MFVEQELLYKYATYKKPKEFRSSELVKTQSLRNFQFRMFFLSLQTIAKYDAKFAELCVVLGAGGS